MTDKEIKVRLEAVLWDYCNKGSYTFTMAIKDMVKIVKEAKKKAREATP